MDLVRNFSKKNVTLISSVLVLLIVVGVIISTSTLLYQRTAEILTNNLRERLLTIGRTTAASIDGEDVDRLREEGDWKTPEWGKVVDKLHDAKYANDNVVFMYIFRYTTDPSDDPKNMEFVADADSIDPYVNMGTDTSKFIDVNRDGIVEPDGPDKLQWPGQSYPESVDIPEAYLAYDNPLTVKDLYTDDYGTVLTGYAQIKNSSGTVVAILGTDIKADDFFTITTQTLEPFLVFISLLSLIITFLICLIIITWRNNTNKLLAANVVIESQKQTLQDLLTIKDETLHIVNHQINTPISVMRGAIDMFKDKLWDSDKLIFTLQKEMIRVKETINLFLSARKYENGVSDLTKIKTEVVTLVDSIIAEKKLLKKVRDDNMQIIFDKKTKVLEVGLDVSKIKEVMSNLLDNAISYSKKDVIVGVESNKDKFIFSVKDSGIGISKENIGKLFNRFTRLDNAKNTRPDGTGLGLYVCKQIIESHGGKIWVESEGEGKGATFKFEIPIA